MQITEIPFYIELRQLYRGGERDEHQLTFGVVGADQPAAVIVASTLFDDSEIVDHIADGDIAVPPSLFNAFALKCFRLMANLVVEHGGASGWWSIPNFSEFIQKSFSSLEADRLIVALSEQATEDVSIFNVCMVADDDAI